MGNPNVSAVVPTAAEYIPWRVH